jgi:hypothetical protein
MNPKPQTPNPKPQTLILNHLQTAHCHFQDADDCGEYFKPAGKNTPPQCSFGLYILSSCALLFLLSRLLSPFILRGNGQLAAHLEPTLILEKKT